MSFDVSFGQGGGGGERRGFSQTTIIAKANIYLLSIIECFSCINVFDLFNNLIR